MKECPGKCRLWFASDANYCEKCGMKLVPTYKCKKCGREMSPTDGNYCRNCGEKRAATI